MSGRLFVAAIALLWAWLVARFMLNSRDPRKRVGKQVRPKKRD